MAALESAVGWAREKKSVRSAEEVLKPLGLAMKKVIGFGLRKVFGKRSQSGGLGRQPWTGDGVSLQSGYHIQDRDLPKIHKAACRGDVSEVKRLLSRHPERLNDRDKQKR